MISANEKKIYKNTIALSLRTALSVPIGFFSVRIAMQVLGIEDYGMANVLGALTAVAVTLSNCIANTSKRFLCFDLADENKKRMRNLFSLLLIIYLGTAALFAIGLEAFGWWMIHFRIKMPEDAIPYAWWYYQFIVATFIVQYVATVFCSLLTAFEKISTLAWAAIFESVFHLLLIASLGFISCRSYLIPYGAVGLLVSVAIFSIYAFYCRKQFGNIVSMRWYWDWKLCRKILGFALWQLQAGVSNSVYGIVNGVLLNNYFSSVINAAQAVSNMINGKITAFGLGFNVASQPQLIKLYAQGRIAEMETLMIRMTKFNFFILLLIGYPVFMNIDFILSIWLKEVPPCTAAFAILGYLLACVNVVCAPGDTVIDATGKIRGMQMFRSVIPWAMLWVIVVWLRNGGGPLAVPIVALVGSVIANVVRFCFVKLLIQRFSICWLVKELATRIGMVCLPCVCLAFVKQMLPLHGGWMGFSAIFAASFLLAAVMVFLFGLTIDERGLLLIAIKSRVTRYLK